MASDVGEGWPPAKRHVLEGSPSVSVSSSVSPNPPVDDEEDQEKKKPVFIIAAVFDWSGPQRSYEWYAFDISNDPKHNQAPPVPPFILPPALSRYYRKIPDHLLPFHEDDDDHASVNLPSVATSSSSLTGWAVLGPTTTTDQPGTLYRIRGHGNSDRVEDPGACVERIKLIKGGGEWVSVAKTPGPVGAPASLVLLGKLYCLGASCKPGRRVGPWPWLMAYDPGLDKWESLPEPLCRPKDRPVFTVAIEGGQLGPAIAFASEDLLQIYCVNQRSWGIEPFDCGHVLGCRKNYWVGQAVAVENMLYWYAMSEQCLVGYDLGTQNWFRGHLPMHNHDASERLGADYPPSLAHLGRGDGVDNKFCLSWVSELPPRPNMKEEQDAISRLHCLKVCVLITNEIISRTGIFLLDVSIITCQSYLVDGSSKAFRGAMLMNGNLGDKTLPKKKQRIQ